MNTTRRFGWAAVATLALYLGTPWATPGASALSSASPARQSAAPSAPVVVEIDQTGTVDPLSAHYVTRAIKDATRRKAEAIVLRIDTPGGLDSSMREIIQAIQNSEVPVLCWVGPPGARAASAGTFILISCPFASMAPGTNVGAAHPVGITGDVLPEKVTNDAAAYIRALALAHGRNENWAEKAVRESVSITAPEAKRLEVIDLVVPSVSELLRQTNGLTIPVADGARSATLQTEGARVEVASMTLGEWLFHNLIDPNLAFLLFVFGIVGIVYEVLHPGLNLAGVLGLLMLISSFLIIGLLPVNAAALILILAGIAFFVLDLKVTAHGLPTFAGIACLVLGGLFLFNASVPKAHVSRGLVVGVAIALGLFFVYVVRAAFNARHMPPGAGVESIVGAVGIVTRTLDPLGVVHVRSEHWSARSKVGKLVEGTKIRVVRVDKLTLEVEPAEAGSELQPEGEGVR
jgi:membrane-bound serine protease (ClpP class)